MSGSNTNRREVVGVSFEPLPKLTERDRQNAAAVFLVDMTMLVDQFIRHARLTEPEADKLRRAETLISRFLANAYGVDDATAGARHVSPLLEHIPENVFRAAVFVAKRIPEFRAALVQDPHERFSGDDPSDFNPFYVAFRRSLEPSDAGTHASPLRAQRIVTLTDLQTEVAHAIDRHRPYPIDPDKISLQDIQRGATELHHRLMEARGKIPSDRRADVERVVRFLETVISPPDALRRTEHAGERERIQRLHKILASDPQAFSFDELSDGLVAGVAKLKLNDVDLNLAFMGHDPETVRFDVLTPPHRGGAGGGAVSLDMPLPFNPFNVAAVNTKRRESEGLATLDELYRLDEFTKLQAEHRSSIDIVSADQAAGLASALEGEGQGLRGLARRAWKVLNKPISEVFSQRQRDLRQERDEQMLAKWQEAIDSTGPDFYPVFPILKQMAEAMEKHKHMRRPRMVEEMHMKLRQIYADVYPSFEWHAFSSKESNLHALKGNIEYVKTLWEERYYFPNYLRGYAEKKNYRLAQEIVSAHSSAIQSLQVLPTGDMCVMGAHDFYRVDRDEKIQDELADDYIHPTWFQATPTGFIYTCRKGGDHLYIFSSKNDRVQNHRINELGATPYQVLMRDSQMGSGVNQDGFPLNEKIELGDWEYFPGRRSRRNGPLPFPPKLLKALPDGTLYGLDDKGQLFIKDPQQKLLKPTLPPPVGGGDGWDDVEIYDARVVFVRRGNLTAKIWLAGKEFSPENDFITDQTKKIFQALPNEKGALCLDQNGSISIFASGKNPAWPGAVKQEILIPKPTDDSLTFAQMQPDGRIVAGTEKGRVLIYDGEPVKQS